MSDKVTATWYIELKCTCPKCDEYVDLTDACDFWCDSRVQPAQDGELEVICPKCDHEFTVDMEY